MADGKKSFLLYCDYIDQFEEMTDEEAGKLIKHLLRYVNDLNPEPVDRMTGLLFNPIKKQLKRDLQRWDGIVSERSKAGHLGGVKSGETRRKQKEANEANASKNEANEAVICNLLDVTEEEDNNIPIEFFSFEDFWTAYGKKEDRKKCEKKWKSVTDKQKAAIKIHVPLYVQSTPDLQYRKNPSTYLNNECWNNEIIQRTPAQLPPPNYNKAYERWDGQKRWCGNVEIPYGAPPRPSNMERWDSKLEKWTFSNF